MSLVRRFLKESGGPWIRAENVTVGATVTIEKVELDEQTFDRPYIVVTGVYDPTGENVKVRLGVKNVQRIVETLGDDESKWIGHKLEVISIETYKGLGRKGILWRGVKTVKQTRMGSPSPMTLEWLAAPVSYTHLTLPTN